MSNSYTTPQSSTSDLKPTRSPSDSKSNKRSVGEKILSAMFDGPSGTRSSKLERELREKWAEDRLDIPRTEKEEKARQVRIQTRSEMMGGGDGVRTNDMQKEGWGGAMLGNNHAWVEFGF